MFEHHLIDLDELVLTVRDRNSREYINEAIVSYRARAYRSALIATWVAVAYDLISKIRELGVQGDAAAMKFVTDLDAAIALQQTAYVVAVQKLQAIENDLLNQALNKFEFLSRQEYKDLERLREDRHLCAHPAFTGDVLFQPSPELVRTHIAHAITHLLQHPPVQGRNALQRLKNDLLQPSFPSTQKDVSDFLEHKYLNRAKKSLVNSLVAVFLKVIIKRTQADLIGKEEDVLRGLVALKIRHPSTYQQKMETELPHLTDSSEDAELKRVFLLFKADRGCWNWLSQPNRLRLIEMTKNYTFGAGDVEQVLNALEIDELKPHLIARLATLDKREKADILSRFHRQEFIDEAINLFAGAAKYRDAESLEKAVLFPLCTMFRAEHIRRILQAGEQNSQIYRAAGSPAFFRDVFERTVDLHEETKAEWQEFMTMMSEGKEPEEESAYPELRKLMEAAGMWPR